MEAFLRYPCRHKVVLIQGSAKRLYSSPSLHHKVTANVLNLMLSHIICRATGSGSTTFTPPSHGRLGEIGIAVLPSIPPPKLLSSSSSTLQPKGELPPPAYKKRASPLSPSSKVSPPPPYSSPSTNQQQHPQATASPVPRRPPRVSPKSYSLPDPEVGLDVY